MPEANPVPSREIKVRFLSQVFGGRADEGFNSTREGTMAIIFELGLIALQAAATVARALLNVRATGLLWGLGRG